MIKSTMKQLLFCVFFIEFDSIPNGYKFYIQIMYKYGMSLDKLDQIQAQGD